MVEVILVSYRIPGASIRGSVGPIGTILLALLSTVAGAQSEQTYKDWTVRCAEQEQGGRCVMSQLLKNRENDEPILLMEVGYLGEGDQPMAQFTVPHGVFLPAGVQLRVDDAEEAGRVPYTVCDKIGCKAIAKLDDKVLAAMKAGNRLVTTLTSPSGDTATMSVSLAGFTAAINALK